MLKFAFLEVYTYTPYQWALVIHPWGDHCHLGVEHSPCLSVGCCPHVLGCAGGGARCLLWFQCDGLSVVVGIRVGGGSSLIQSVGIHS